MLFPEGIRSATWRSPFSDCSSTDAEGWVGGDMPKDGSGATILGREWRNDDEISKTILNDYECSCVC